MPLGRPRSFDTDAALDSAMRVFWRKGYEGSSMPALTAAMGINRPSLYAAYGNKEALFRKALDRYHEGPASYLPRALSAPTAREAVEAMFYGSLSVLTNPENPGGCLMVQAALACSEDAETLRLEINARRAAAEALIRERMERAHAEGDLPSRVNPADFARYLFTVLVGMAVQASGGASREDLEKVIAHTLNTFPC
jgi:AcrR family transcriptional regulator